MTDSSLLVRLAESIPDGPHRMTVGLRPLAPADWIEDGADYEDQLRERAALLRDHDDVLSALPGSQDAQRELLDLLVEHLRQHFADRYTFVAPDKIRIHATGQTLHFRRNDHSVDGALRSTAHMVPEDLCLLQRAHDDRYRLSAAALCFPTRWRLADKLGQPLMGIHAPVPGYADSVGAATERVLASLDATRALWRQNWSLLDSAELYQPIRVEPQQPIDGDESHITAVERLWFRSERQTLRRLPKTGAVLFTIRIRQCALAELCQVPGAAARLHKQVQSMPNPLITYKGLSGLAAPLLAYLRAASRGTIRS